MRTGRAGAIGSELGASALNSPSREKAANTATAAANSPRPRCGRPRPVKRTVDRQRGLTVSGTRNKHRPAAARYTPNTRTV